jgi:hypothetical protein
MKRKDHDFIWVLLSNSITSTLFAIHHADQIDAAAHKPFHLAYPTTRRSACLLTPARYSSMSLLSAKHSHITHVLLTIHYPHHQCLAKP